MGRFTTSCSQFGSTMEECAKVFTELRNQLLENEIKEKTKMNGEKLTKEKIIKGFNKWLDEFINNPEAFSTDEEERIAHLQARNEGKEPDYGERCFACLEKYSPVGKKENGENLINSMDGTGILTLRNWVYAGADQYKAFWSRNWRLITDKQLVTGGLRSNDRWGMVALVDDTVVIVIPGCEVLGFITHKECPATDSVCNIDQMGTL